MLVQTLTNLLVVQLSKSTLRELHSVYTESSEHDPDLRCESFDLDSLSEEVASLTENKRRKHESVLKN